MSDNMSHPVEIDLKDLLCVVLKNTQVLILTGVIVAVAACGYLFIDARRSADKIADNANVLDTEKRLSGESDEEYGNRVSNINRAHNIMANIDALNAQVEVQNNYLTESLYMQLDPLNISTSSASVAVSFTYSTDYAVKEAVCSAYQSYVDSNVCLADVAETLDVSPESLCELVSCTRSSGVNSAGVLIDDGNGITWILTVKVIGSSVEFTETVLDSILSNIDEETDVINEDISAHTLSVINRSNSVSFNSGVREDQLNAVKTLNDLQTQIKNLNSNLDDIGKQLGFTDRSGFYQQASSDSPETPSPMPSATSIIKYCGIGFILGIIVAGCFLAVSYVFGRKISSQSQFFSHFPYLEKIGICKPQGDRSKFIAFLDRLSGDDSGLSEENTNGIISNNCANLTSGMNKVLITGTAEDDAAKKVITDLKLKGDVELNMFNNPDVLKDAAEYDGVVLIEQRGVSDKKLVREQIRLLKNSGRKIIGAILI